MDNKKKPLCRMKENCTQWLAKKDCGFDHVLCKFNQTCKDKQKCIFYHMAKPAFDKPKSEATCKFGAKCSRPGCPFKHEAVVEQQPFNPSREQAPNVEERKPFNPAGKQTRDCKFGVKCIKPDCWFRHPERQGTSSQSGFGNQFPKPFQNQIKRESTQMQSIFQGSSQNQPIRLQNKFCLDFLLTNNCSNGQSCQKLHQFTDKSSLKRVFFTNQIPDRDFNIVSYEHARDGDVQNKDLIYVVQEGDSLSFRKLISSQNLYKDYGGIGANNQNKTYLRSISNQIYKAEGVINGLQAFTYNRSEYLVFMVGLRIFIYNTTRGDVDQVETSRMGNRLTGCVLIPEKGVLLLATLELGVKRFQFNEERQKFQQTAYNELVMGMKSLRITDSQILGESVIYGVTTTNTLILMNKDLRLTSVAFPNGSTISDADIYLANNKIPVALVTATLGNRQHQLIGVNLLNFEKQVVMQYEFGAGISKIFTIEGHLMVEVKNKGLLVYKANELQNSIGLVPLMNEIQEVRRDNKGNLLILESGSIEGKGSISVFKVKRV